MKKLLLLISIFSGMGLMGCHPTKTVVGNLSPGEVKTQEHPAPDQEKIDSLKTIREKDKKPILNSHDN